MKLRFTLLTVTLLFAVSSHASTTIVYEPHTYIREIAKPTTSSDTFKACDPKGSFKIIVDNGDEKEKNRISSARISINGIPIITQNDFNQKTARIEKPLTNIIEENTITVKLNSKPWSQMTVSVEGVMSCLEVNISEPLDGATINKGTTIIRGTLESQTADVGIRVNGVLAEIQGENWIAAGVPLTEGENEIKVVAIDGTGNTDEKKITINTESTLQALTVNFFPSNGIAPLETSFKIETNTNNSISSYKIDFDGDGVIDMETASPDEISHRFEVPGLYLPVVTVVDNAGVKYTEMTVVNAMSREQMDELLQAKWNGMKDGLNSGDVEKTIAYFTDASQERYRGLFSYLSDRLPEMAADMNNIQMIYLRDGRAKYRTRRIEDGQEVTYYIYFHQLSDGLWKIHHF